MVKKSMAIPAGQVQIGEDQVQALNSFMQMFGRSSELGEIYNTLTVLMEHDTFLKALVIMAINDGISGRKLARRLKVSFGVINRKLNKWVGSGLISRDNGCHVRRDVRSGLLTMATRLNLVDSLS